LCCPKRPDWLWGFFTGR